MPESAVAPLPQYLSRWRWLIVGTSSDFEMLPALWWREDIYICRQVRESNHSDPPDCRGKKVYGNPFPGKIVASTATLLSVFGAIGLKSSSSPFFIGAAAKTFLLEWLHHYKGDARNFPDCN
jgi:hypothetical protein